MVIVKQMSYYVGPCDSIVVHGHEIRHCFVSAACSDHDCYHVSKGIVLYLESKTCTVTMLLYTNSHVYTQIGITDLFERLRTMTRHCLCRIQFEVTFDSFASYINVLYL